MSSPPVGAHCSFLSTRFQRKYSRITFQLWTKCDPARTTNTYSFLSSNTPAFLGSHSLAYYCMTYTNTYVSLPQNVHLMRYELRVLCPWVLSSPFSIRKTHTSIPKWIVFFLNSVIIFSSFLFIRFFFCHFLRQITVERSFCHCAPRL